MTSHLIGKLAREKAKRLTSLKDYKRIAASYGEWLQLENDNALYRRHALLVLSDELAEKVQKELKISLTQAIDKLE